MLVSATCVLKERKGVIKSGDRVRKGMGWRFRGENAP